MDTPRTAQLDGGREGLPLVDEKFEKSVGSHPAAE
jgi:hypothetical protein